MSRVHAAPLLRDSPLPNALPFRRGPLLAVAWNGLFGTARSGDSTRPSSVGSQSRRRLLILDPFE
jgi:hypothetical protein